VLALGTSNQLDLGLAFTCDGRLWMSAGTGQFWQVDPTNANVTSIGNLSVTITGLAAKGNELFGTGSQGNNNLYLIDPTTASATTLGSYGSANYITTASPGFDSTGKLWAILDYVPPQQGNTSVTQWSDLAQFTLATGALTDLGTITPPSSASKSSPEYVNLAYIGLKGLAIPNNICAVTASLDSLPVLDARGLIALIATMLLLGGTRLRRRRPSC
jgi:hypothetical protein